MKNKTLITIALVLIVSNIAKAQDLLDQLYFEEEKQTVLTEATFKMLRIGFSHSVETRKKGVLEVSSYTRFWNVPKVDGVDAERSNFGADRASARFGFDYALSDNLSGGAGWANSGVFDGYLKYRLLRQKTGEQKTPFSLTLVTAGSFRSESLNNTPVTKKTNASLYNSGARRTSITRNDNFTDKTTFTGQLLLARKLDRNFSLQLSPTLIARGSTTFDVDPQFQFALGFGGRYKVGKHVSIASEYFYVPNKLKSKETFGPFSLGVNWEVSKVQIQMFLTHTGNFSEDLVITETPVNFNTKDGNLFFGWNFSYVFHLKKKR